MGLDRSDRMRWGYCAAGDASRGVLRPGLHLCGPPPFETVARVRPEQLRSVAIGFRSERPEASAARTVRWESSHAQDLTARSEEESLVLSGDGRLVELTAVVQFRLDPRPEALRRYAFGASEPEAAVRPLAEAAVRAVVGQRIGDDVLTGRRQESERAIAALLQARIEAYGLGLNIVQVAFQDVHPPRGVVDAFRDVSRARAIGSGAAMKARPIARRRSPRRTAKPPPFCTPPRPIGTAGSPAPGARRPRSRIFLMLAKVRPR